MERTSVTMQMRVAYLGIGSNLGDRVRNMCDALRFLNDQEGVQIIKVSSFYETEPVGYLDQGMFLNAAVEIKTSLSPLDLLYFIQEIENKLKRKRTVKWGPRTIDIDILLYEDVKIDEEDLKVPHPFMKERSFVLVPLFEIAPDVLDPDGISVREMLNSLDNRGDVKTLFRSRLVSRFD